MTDNMSTTSTVPQQGLMDPIDSLLDLSDYDNVQQYNSPTLSPATSKNNFVRATAASTPSSILSATQPMTGPSHQYDQYKQQTGFVPGALANTFAVNQNNAQMGTTFNNYDMSYIPVGSNDEMFDFNTAPHNASVSPSDIGLDFESSSTNGSYYIADGNTPMSVIPGQAPQVMAMPSNLAPNNGQANTVGRLWPGMHQQAAIAKAQAQQRQQQQIIQQQQRQNQVKQQQQQQQQQGQRHKSAQPADPIVEQKITELLNSMRQKSSSPTDANGMPIVNIGRPKKDEDDMDEDERLLASEEGKKLSSKERRQLRNKVSARAFRSRRKEYISQLEAEIATKVSENGDLRTQNRSLIEENKRLSDLTRMLLGSPSFSDFLDRLSSNPSLIPQGQAQQAPQPEPRQERQAPKDSNPYSAQQQIGMAMIPEQHVDLSMLQLDEPTYAFQPQVFAVQSLDIPACIDASMLSGKTSNFVGCSVYDADEEKMDMPVIAHPIVEKRVMETHATVPVDESFENDPAFSLYHDAPTTAAAVVTSATESFKPVELNNVTMPNVDVFGGIDSEKALARYELVDVVDGRAGAVSEEVAIARINLLASNLKGISARLDMLVPEA
ncbi:bzip transcription factor [Grosmannia clavigera kw1407]|uniref:Bzip transcription factor n=1 Tax=Grosmannia clavigera (strain kw1407 / UAMH 11150) TaxID=655863 RepID=F0X6Z0_GROCL|nr:bzip transcription factor [Grosmannia clavigera kw1407]EFX06217.1 bzip transcription factor [Grosmannia clavigera kw1407]